MLNPIGADRIFASEALQHKAFKLLQVAAHVAKPHAASAANSFKEVEDK